LRCLACLPACLLAALLHACLGVTSPTRAASFPSCHQCPAACTAPCPRVPQAYRKEEEETDELLLFDEDVMDLDPEYLPRRLLTDFSIYNADVSSGLVWGVGGRARRGWPLPEGLSRVECLPTARWMLANAP
jgi:hypothetical protein